MIQENFFITTERSTQIISLNEDINFWLKEKEADQGLFDVTVLHTTAAVSTACLDPGTDLDIIEAYYGMIPNIDFRHPHDPSHTPDHLLATLIGPGLSLPVSQGRLVLGQWQEVVLLEFDGPKKRTLVFTFRG